MPAAFTQPQPADAAAISVDSAWWRHFGDPTLDGLIEGARTRSPDVQAAAARIIQADQAARVAGSPLLPSVTGTGSQNWTRRGHRRGGWGNQRPERAAGGSRYTNSAPTRASFPPVTKSISGARIGMR